MMDSADGFGYKIFTDATADFSADMLRRYPLVEIIPMEDRVVALLYGERIAMKIKGLHHAAGMTC